MKKLIIGLISAMLLCTTAYAADSDECVAVVYENGILYSCANGTYENGALYADVNLPAEGGVIKAFFTDSGTVEIAADMLNPAKGEPTASSEPTAASDVTPEPTAAPTTAPAPEKTPRPTYHPVYESEKDAVEAIAVVKSVGIVATDSDENMYEIKAYYRGEDFSFIVEQDITISTAPSVLPELAGADLLNLSEGDVIMITCRISGGVKRVDLIARAADYDIITSGADIGASFEDLFSNGSVVAGRTDWKVLEYGDNPPSDGTAYAFGVIRERKDGTMVLVNEAGLDADAHYLDLSENVIVYTCDMENKTELSMGGESSIIRSSIPKTDLDDDDNVINWEEGRSYVYALARIVDGTVTEVVVYKGYKK